MADRIKGITVKIGGDVTGLDKALKGVNSEIVDTQKKLKEVERLLKLDPTNTELLAQKQAYLAQKVEATSTKFEELKKAQDSVTASNVKYEEWQRAFTPLQGQITKTEKTLASLEKEQQKLQDLGFAPDSQPMVELQTQITASQKRLESLHKTVNDTYEAMGRPVSVEQFRDLQRQTIAAGEAAKEAKKDYDSFNPTLAQVGATAEKTSKKLDSIAKATKGVSTAAGGALGAITAAALGSASLADDLNTTAKQTGFSTETLQEMRYAADLIDTSYETVTSAAAKMKKNMASSSADVVAAWNKLGFSTMQYDYTMRDTEATFFDVIKSLSLIESEIERDTIAYTIFGRSADELAGYIDDGGAAFKELGKQAKEAGYILDEEALSSLNEVNDKLDTLKANAQGTLAVSGAAALEALLPIFETVLGKADAVLNWIANLDEGSIRLITTILAVIAAISPLAKIGSNVFDLVSKVSGALPGLSAGAEKAGNAVVGVLDKAGESILTFLSNPVVLVIGAVIALVALIATKGDEIQAILQKVDDFLQNIFAKDWTEVFGPVLGDVLNGFFHNLEGIWNAIKDIFNGIIDFIRGVFTGDWERAWKGVVEIFTGLWEGLKTIVTAPINGIITILNAAISGINMLIDGLNTLNFDIPDWVPMLGGKQFGFNFDHLNTIPYLANGGILSSGSAVVGEAGPELLTMMGGKAVVQPLTATVDGGSLAAAMNAAEGERPLVLNATFRFEGSLAQFGRVIEPSVTAAIARRGENLVKGGS